MVRIIEDDDTIGPSKAKRIDLIGCEYTKFCFQFLFLLSVQSVGQRHEMMKSAK